MARLVDVYGVVMVVDNQDRDVANLSYLPFYNPKDFRYAGGAKGGGADDTLAFNACISAAAAQSPGGAIVLCPPDRYAASQILLKDKVWLWGCQGSVLQSIPNNPNDSLITFADTSVTRTEIRGFKINVGSGIPQSGTVSAIKLIGAGTGNPRHVIANNHILSPTGHGIDVGLGCLVTHVVDNYIDTPSQNGIIVRLGAGDSNIINNNIRQAGLEGILVDAWNCKTQGNKPFFSGFVTPSRGDGFKITGNNHMSVNDEPQDNQRHGWNLTSCKSCTIFGGQPGDNGYSGTGAAVYIKGGSYHRLAVHASGGTRQQHTGILSFDTDGTFPANCFIDASYDPASLTGAAILGTVPTTNFVRLNGKLYYQGAQITVSGSRGGNAALASLLTALANLGVVIDGSSA